MEKGAERNGPDAARDIFIDQEPMGLEVLVCLPRSVQQLGGNALPALPLLTLALSCSIFTHSSWLVLGSANAGFSNDPGMLPFEVRNNLIVCLLTLLFL